MNHRFRFSTSETPLNICRLAIGHCEVNRGQWPQRTLVDLETHMTQGQGSQLVISWHQSYQLSPFKFIAPRRSCVYSRFRWNFAEGCSLCDVITTWPDQTRPIFFTKSCAKDAHKLCKISARYSKRCSVQLRKTHGVVASTPPPLHWRGLKCAYSLCIMGQVKDLTQGSFLNFVHFSRNTHNPEANSAQHVGLAECLQGLT